MLVFLPCRQARESLNIYVSPVFTSAQSGKTMATLSPCRIKAHALAFLTTVLPICHAC
jgi:hypothetical protein